MTTQGERRFFSTNGTGKNWKIHMQKNEDGPLSYIIYKY